MAGCRRRAPTIRRGWRRRGCFIVDPIDGTIAFLKGRPHFTISVAVVEAGRPVSGAVHNPMTMECFLAAEGAGARLNGEPIHVSTQAAIAGCRMLAPKSAFADPMWAEPPATPWPDMTVETRSSIAYRMALVACGSYDAMLSLSAKHDWDLAAGDLIVREAGGLASDRTGVALRYNRAATIQPSVVCAGPALHAELLTKLAPIPLP